MINVTSIIYINYGHSYITIAYKLTTKYEIYVLYVVMVTLKALS